MVFAKNVIDEMITVSENEMIQAMKFAAHHLKLFLEPACVCGIAALNNNLKNKLKNQNTLLILLPIKEGSGDDTKSPTIRSPHLGNV